MESLLARVTVPQLLVCPEIHHTWYQYIIRSGKSPSELAVEKGEVSERVEC